MFSRSDSPSLGAGIVRPLFVALLIHIALLGQGACTHDWERYEASDDDEGTIQACPSAGICDALVCNESNCSVGCAASSICDATCKTGACPMECSASAQCTFSCESGGCNMECGASATCGFSCPGGGCTFECQATSQCETSCTGGGCSTI